MLCASCEKRQAARKALGDDLEMRITQTRRVGRDGETIDERRCYNFFVADLGKLLIFVGILAVLAGIVLLLLSRTGLPIGRLPGDILYRGKNTTFYFPLATSLLLSVVLSILLYVIARFRR
jgi:hypothetical protein